MAGREPKYGCGFGDNFTVWRLWTPLNKGMDEATCGAASAESEAHGALRSRRVRLIVEVKGRDEKSRRGCDETASQSIANAYACATRGVTRCLMRCARYSDPTGGPGGYESASVVRRGLRHGCTQGE